MAGSPAVGIVPAAGTVRAVQPAPIFLPADAGRLHVARWLPAGPGGETTTAGTGAVLLVPPFAEELNKCRRMLALLGQGLAARGVPAVLPDLRGTGDSDGEFADARWGRWLDDLRTVSGWLERSGTPVTGLVGLRLGARLALDLAADLPGLRRVILWQPVFSGRQHLSQFLRLRMAGGLLGGEAGETVATLREALLAGRTLEVAGYDLSPELAADLEALHGPAPVPPAGVPLHCLEVSPGETPTLSRVTADQVARWQAAGVEASGEVLPGESFWSTVEIGTAPALLTRSLALLLPSGPDRVSA
jgi:exosortase A-associated hydrolase 2